MSEHPFFAVGLDFPGNRDQKGYIFKVLDRDGDVCLLQKSNPNHESGQKYYEVVILKHVPGKRWPGGRVTQAHEAMPSPEEWGVYGWSPWDLEASRERFRLVTSRQSAKGVE